MGEAHTPRDARDTGDVDAERREAADAWQLIEELTQQVKANRVDIDALLARADAAEARADAAEARADDIHARSVIDREMIAELQVEGELSREHAEQMEMALRTSRTIGAAMGMIMASRNVTDEQAFAILVKASQDSNKKLRDIALLVIEGTSGDAIPSP